MLHEPLSVFSVAAFFLLSLWLLGSLDTFVSGPGPLSLSRVFNQIVTAIFYYLLLQASNISTSPGSDCKRSERRKVTFIYSIILDLISRRVLCRGSDLFGLCHIMVARSFSFCALRSAFTCPCTSMPASAQQPSVQLIVKNVPRSCSSLTLLYTISCSLLYAFLLLTWPCHG